MTYLANLQKDSVEVNYFYHIGSRFLLDETWTNLSSSVYYIAWDDRPIGKIGLEIDGVFYDHRYVTAESYADMLACASSAYQKAIWYDTGKRRLYVNFVDVDPNSETLYAERFYYVSSVYAGWRALPDVESSYDVQYQGIVASSPSISASSSEIIYGFTPSQSGAITVCNENNYFDNVFSDGSIANATFDIYRCVGEIKAENFQKCFMGYLRSTSYTDLNISFNYVDASVLLDKKLDLDDDAQWPSDCEPSMKGTTPRAFVVGYVEGALGNVVHYDSTKDVTLNRRWRFGNFFGDPTRSGEAYLRITTLNSAVGSNTTGKTYIDAACVPFAVVGRYIFRNGVSTSGDFRQIASVGSDGTGNFITHVGITALGASDYFDVSPIERVAVVDRSSKEGFDISSTYVGFDKMDIIFDNNAEGSLSIPNQLHPEDYYIYALVHTGVGSVNFTNGSTLSNATTTITGYNQNPIQVIYEILYSAGFYDIPDFYDQDSFVDTAAEIDIPLDFCSPSAQGDFEGQSYRDIISKICETCLLKLFMKNGKWHITRMKPLGATTQTINTDNADVGLDYTINAEEVVRQVIIKYGLREVTDFRELSPNWRSTSATSDISTSLNSNHQSKTVETYLKTKTDPLVNDDAITVRDRYLGIFSYPFSYLRAKLGLEFMDLKINDVVEVVSDEFTQLPIISGKKFSVISITENEDSVDVELFDQKGIEENTGSW